MTDTNLELRTARRLVLKTIKENCGRADMSEIQKNLNDRTSYSAMCKALHFFIKKGEVRRSPVGREWEYRLT